MAKKCVSIGFLGSRLDRGSAADRWLDWRPSVAICQHEDLLIDRFELFHEKSETRLANDVSADIATVSPETNVRLHEFSLRDPGTSKRCTRPSTNSREPTLFDPIAKTT